MLKILMSTNKFWNRLSGQVIEAATDNTFKNSFDKLKKGTP